MSKPTVVTLCGSTRFKDEFAAANLRETLAGRMVFSIGCDLRTDHDIFGHLPPQEIEAIKKRLDTLHLCKIDASDEILVLDVGGYIGESTAREIAHAAATGKRIRYLSQETPS